MITGRNVVSGLMLTLLLVSMLRVVFNVEVVVATGTIYIRADGSIDPPTAPIQRDGDIYTSTDDINDSIVVQRSNIIIDGAGYAVQGSGSGDGFDIIGVDNVTIKKTNIKRWMHGVHIELSSFNTVFGNKITNCDAGIVLHKTSNYNKISGNNITTNIDGIELVIGGLACPTNNSISGNAIVANQGDGILLSGCSDNHVYGNNIEGNGHDGIRLYGAFNNSIDGNNITANSEYGILLYYSSNNSIYHNNFRNARQVHIATSGYPNRWDDGYPSGGNYWSDYTDVDLYSGPYQNETGSDGIWDHQYIINTDNIDKYPLVNPWSVHIIDVPFHYQTIDYYCGPACLEMVFDYYGEDICQVEIAEVARTHPYTTYTDELRRAAHFSNISTSSGIEMPENITGYTLRQLGYAAFERWSITMDQLKTLIDKGYPILLLMWYSPLHVSGHYRVAVGYNSTHIILHDPWNNIEWGGTYGGPYLAFNYSTFLDLWQYSGYWGLLTCPWNTEFDIPLNIHEGDTFAVTANITYPSPAPFQTTDYPASLCNATITLPTGLILAQGETNKKTLGNILAGSSTLINWTVKAESIGTFNITVETEGKVDGSVSAHESFPSYNYEDRIGSSSSGILEVLGHDISVNSVVSSKTIVGQGYSLSINVTVENQGAFTETFNVTTYANTTVTETKEITLTSGASTILTFTWNTKGVAKGNYTIKAVADTVPGETDTTDNTCPNGIVFVTIPSDVNGDQTVNILDCIIIANHFGHKNGNGHTPSTKEWKDCLNSDINCDNAVNILDCIIQAGHFGQKWL